MFFEHGGRNSIPRAAETAEEPMDSKEMSAVQEAVPWENKDLKLMWTSQAFLRSVLGHQARVTLLYKASALLCIFAHPGLSR